MNLSDIPAFGMEFKLKKKFSHVRYDGKGPMENATHQEAVEKVQKFNMQYNKRLTGANLYGRFYIFKNFF